MQSHRSIRNNGAVGGEFDAKPLNAQNLRGICVFQPWVVQTNGGDVVGLAVTTGR